MGKGTNLVTVVDSKIFDRQFKIVNLAIYSKVDGAYYAVSRLQFRGCSFAVAVSRLQLPLKPSTVEWNNNNNNNNKNNNISGSVSAGSVSAGSVSDGSVSAGSVSAGSVSAGSVSAE